MEGGGHDSTTEPVPPYARLRQGDYSTAPGAFWYVTSFEAHNADLDVVADGDLVEGLVLVTQTCDLVRPPEVRPFVLVAPLVYVAESNSKAARNGYLPQLVWVPAAGQDAFVDLDRAVSYDKRFISDLVWRSGVRTPEEASRFAHGVGRKFSRFAFPDEFHESVAPFEARVRDKHGSLTKPEGEFFTKVRQIRVEADWSADEIEAVLIFIVDGADLPAIPEDKLIEPPVELVTWSKHRRPDEVAEKLAATTDQAGHLYLWNQLVDKWTAVCNPKHPVTQITAEVTTSEDFSLERYWRTYRLDLDYLSGVHDRSET